MMLARDMKVGRQYHLKDGKIVEFSRVGPMGDMIVHPPGEPDMQSSLAIKPTEEVAECAIPGPVRKLLYCPACQNQHIDKAEWATPAKAHRTHLCESCGHKWRPFDFYTIGVESLP